MNNIPIFLFFMAFIIIVLILLSVFNDNPIVNSFSDKVVILVLFFSAYTAHESFSFNTEQNDFVNYLKISDNQFKIIQYINENYEKCPNFINTFFFNWQKNVLSKNTIETKQIVDKWITVYYISEMIFKSFDNYTSYVNKVGSNSLSSHNQKNYKLINFFIQFTISEDLRKIWNIYKYKYPEHTINFGDLLFSLTEKYKPKNVIEINKLVNVILNDRYYLLMFEKK